MDCIFWKLYCELICKGFGICEIVLVGIFNGLKPSGYENCGRTAVMIIQLIFLKDVNVNSWLY